MRSQRCCTVRRNSSCEPANRTKDECCRNGTLSQTSGVTREDRMARNKCAGGSRVVSIADTWESEVVCTCHDKCCNQRQWKWPSKWTWKKEWKDRKKKMVGCDLERYENCRCVRGYDAGDRVQWRFTTRLVDREMARRDGEQKTVYTHTLYTIYRLCVWRLYKSCDDNINQYLILKFTIPFGFFRRWSKTKFIKCSNKYNARRSVNENDLLLEKICPEKSTYSYWKQDFIFLPVFFIFSIIVSSNLFPTLASTRLI